MKNFFLFFFFGPQVVAYIKLMNILFLPFLFETIIDI